MLRRNMFNFKKIKDTKENNAKLENQIIDEMKNYQDGILEANKQIEELEKRLPKYRIGEQKWFIRQTDDGSYKPVKETIINIGVWKVDNTLVIGYRSSEWMSSYTIESLIFDTKPKANELIKTFNGKVKCHA